MYVASYMTGIISPESVGGRLYERRDRLCGLGVPLFKGSNIQPLYLNVLVHINKGYQNTKQESDDDVGKKLPFPYSDLPPKLQRTIVKN